jgi:magnesium chelatase accessory protein
LAARYTVIAPDLPGHGFTDTPPPERLGLEGMADSLAAFVERVGARPRLVIGHSAGAAILVQLCAAGRLVPAHLVSLNGALLPFGGAAGVLFSPLARLFAGLPFLPQMVSWRARETTAVRRLIASTGSEISPEGIEYYRRLLENPGHVAAVVHMMAQWDLRALERSLPGLTVPVVLVVGERDKAVPLRDAERLKRLIPRARLVRLPGLGHLAHEENPRAVARAILDSI